MGSTSGRRSDRVSLTLLLEASGKDSRGQEFKDPAKTLVISRHGAVVILERELAIEQEIHLRRQAPGETRREGSARVVGQFGKQRDGYLYGVEIVNNDVDLWGIEFPAVAESDEAVARMLLECCYCHNREVIHLNGLELRAFETNRGIAHHCRNCGVPSIWTQALQEDEKKLSGRGSRVKRSHPEALPQPAPENEQRARQRTRLKTRLTACVRQPGADDELAVCEDISPLGMCFRSKRRYESNAPIEVAVPYSPDAANIFLPARIVYSEEMPKAGLFRHGTEYRKIPARSE
jgi:hypothetical protein